MFLELVVGDEPTSAPTTSDEPTSAPITSVCSQFDFTDDQTPQDGGEDCSPNVLEEAREDQNLSLIVSLFEVSGLEDIFNCAGE